MASVLKINKNRTNYLNKISENLSVLPKLKNDTNDVIELKLSNFTIHEIKDKLQKDFNLDDFNINNFLIAINGVEISALEGMNSKIQEGDEISIITLVHGG